eukprot:8422437-Pyramimonas_sp.AAC.1
MEGWWFSKCGSRLSAARIRFQSSQQLEGVKMCPVQNVALERRAHVPRMVFWRGLGLSAVMNSHELWSGIFRVASTLQCRYSH